MTYDVITFGAATRDIFVRASALEIQEAETPDHQYDACFPLGAKIDVQEMIFETGGGATNAAVTFGRLGWKAACVTSVGRDAVADDIAKAIKQDGVSSAFFQHDPKLATGASVILLSGSGERTILVHRGASAAISAKRVPWPKLRARWFYCSSFGGDLDLLRRVFAQAKKVGAHVAWNPGNKELAHGFAALEPFIRQADVFNLNKEEAADLAGLPPSDLADIISKLASLPRRVLVITDGKAGAYVADASGTWHGGIIDVPRRNVTGAGDSFGSGLIAGLLKKDDVRYALAVATWNATGVVQHMGAKRGLLKKYPTAKQIAAVPLKSWQA
jgi:sugar/nucleoside kinase (ribokinase family)